MVPTSDINYKRIWNLSWPIILANITIPLIGATNIAVMGRMPSPIYIGAVALGVVVLQCIYWSFSFLRKGTTGIAAQAYGAGDKEKIYATLFRSLIIAFCLGTTVIVLQKLISWIAFNMIDGSEEVERLAKVYFDIRIWGSIATMGNYVMLGWFYGVQRPKLALVLRVAMNALNIPLAIYLVLGLKWGVEGAAWSALISHHFVFILSLIAAAFLMKKELADKNGKIDWSFLKSVTEKASLITVFRINGDIFVRTILLFFAFSWFTAASAKHSDLALAANTVLINLFWFISYALDGFANAAEALVGQSIGAKNENMFMLAIKKTSFMGAWFAILFSLTYFFFGENILSLLTNLDSVQNEAMIYMPWLIFIPLTGVTCFQLDGIYIGATSTKIIRNMMIVSFLVYALAVIGLPKIWGNHGLWMALHIFMIARAITLLIPFKKMQAEVFNE